MSIPHHDIYRHHAASYHLLRSRMDHAGNIEEQIRDLVSPDGKDIVELAAGTGILTRLLVPHARCVRAFDLSGHMVAYGQSILSESGYANWSFAVADSRDVPLPSGTADIVLEGWSLGYVAALGGPGWKEEVSKVVEEMDRLLKPGGTALVLGSLGTGAHDPKPPNKTLEELYLFLEREAGFVRTDWFKTDYLFETIDEAAMLTEFFWSPRLSAHVRHHRLTCLPECTAIWHYTKPTA